jgi:hypothetical protein
MTEILPEPLDDGMPFGNEPYPAFQERPWPENPPGGNCGCGYLGTCWTVSECGCEWDHGQLWPCEVHQRKDANAEA